MVSKKETIKFKLKLDVSAECSEEDIKESIETNFVGSLEDNNSLNEESKFILIEKADDEDSEPDIELVCQGMFHLIHCFCSLFPLYSLCDFL